MIDVHTSVCVTCDICGKQKTIEDERESIKNVKNQLKEEGWKFGKKEICPICNGKQINIYLTVFTDMGQMHHFKR